MEASLPPVSELLCVPMTALMKHILLVLWCYWTFRRSNLSRLIFLFAQPWPSIFWHSKCATQAATEINITVGQYIWPRSWNELTTSGCAFTYSYPGCQETNNRTQSMRSNSRCQFCIPAFLHIRGYSSAGVAVFRTFSSTNSGHQICTRKSSRYDTLP